MARTTRIERGAASGRSDFFSLLLLLVLLCSATPAAARRRSRRTRLPRALVRSFEREIRRIVPAIITLRRDIHAHPERGNREFRTARNVADKLRRAGLEVKTGVAHTGVVAILRTGRPGPVVAWRGDMDALPILEKTKLPFASKTPGVMHACGHDIHTAVGVGVATVLAKHRRRLRGTVKFIFQPAEEWVPKGEEGGAKLMIKEGVLEAPAVQAIFGLHVDPHLEAGRYGLNFGVGWASVDNFTITFRGKQCHAGWPWCGKDALYNACSFVVQLQSVVSRRIDPRKPAVVHVGAFKVEEPVPPGKRNVMAGKVRIEGTVRTHSPATRVLVEKEIRRLAEAVRLAGDLKRVRIRYKNGSPSGYLDPPLNRWGWGVLENCAGKAALEEKPPRFGAEDFSRYLRRVRGIFFRLGAASDDRTDGPGLHTSEVVLDERAIASGMRAGAHLLAAYLLKPPRLPAYRPPQGAGETTPRGSAY